MLERNKPLCVAVGNEKGGVSKTTCVVHLAAALATAGIRVLVIDLDPQVDASEWIAYGTDKQATVFDMFSDVTRGVGAYSTPIRERLSIVYGDRRMGGIESAVFARVNRPLRLLKRALNVGAEAYDVVLIDCPPTVGRISLNAYVAADEVIIPITPSELATKGMTMVMTSISGIVGTDDDGGEIAVAPQCRVLRSKFDDRLVAAKQAMLDIEAWPDLPVFKTVIRATAIGERIFRFHETFFEADPKGKTALDFTALADEFLDIHPALRPAVSA